MAFLIKCHQNDIIFSKPFAISFKGFMNNYVKSDGALNNAVVNESFVQQTRVITFVIKNHTTQASSAVMMFLRTSFSHILYSFLQVIFANTSTVFFVAFFRTSEQEPK